MTMLTVLYVRRWTNIYKYAWALVVRLNVICSSYRCKFVSCETQHRSNALQPHTSLCSCFVLLSLWYIFYGTETLNTRPSMKICRFRFNVFTFYYFICHTRRVTGEGLWSRLPGEHRWPAKQINIGAPPDTNWNVLTERLFNSCRFPTSTKPTLTEEGSTTVKH